MIRILIISILILLSIGLIFKPVIEKFAVAGVRKCRKEIKKILRKKNPDYKEDKERYKQLATDICNCVDASEYDYERAKSVCECQLSGDINPEQCDNPDGFKCIINGIEGMRETYNGECVIIDELDSAYNSEPTPYCHQWVPDAPYPTGSFLTE
jgi:hypothetical protein